MPVRPWLTSTLHGLLSKGAVTGVFDMTKKHGDPESSRRFFFLFLFRRKKWKVQKQQRPPRWRWTPLWCGSHPSCSDPHLNVNVPPRCQVLLHNSDLKRGAYISSSRSLGPDSRHLLCKGPLRAAGAPQRPSDPLLTSSNRVWYTSLICQKVITDRGGARWRGRGKDASVDVTGSCGHPSCVPIGS